MSNLPEIEALALLEIEGIPSALRAQDEALKMAEIQIVAFAPVSPGKVIFIFAGDVASVEASLEAADESLGPRRIDQLMLPFVHPSVVQALHNQRVDAPAGQAIGMLELKTVASGILCADAGVKSANVTLSRIHPASGFGGKTFVTFWGEQADVEAAVEAAVEMAGSNTLDHEVIAAPHSELDPNRFVRPWSLDPAS